LQGFLARSATLRACRWREEGESGAFFRGAEAPLFHQERHRSPKVCAPPGFIRQSGACGGIFEALFA